MRKIIFCLISCLFSSCMIFQVQKNLAFDLQSMSKFEFSRGGYWIGGYSLEITNIENKIISIYNYKKFGEEKHEMIAMERNVYERFINELSLIKIRKWKRRYDNTMTDGEGWSLIIEFNDGQKPIIKSGYMNYPEDWERFKNIIIKYFPQMYYRYAVRIDENTGKNIIVELEK